MFQLAPELAVSPPDSACFDGLNMRLKVPLSAGNPAGVERTCSAFKNNGSFGYAGIVISASRAQYEAPSGAASSSKL